MEPYPDYKESNIEWLVEIPGHWNEIAIKHLASLKSGENITSQEIDQDGQYAVYGGNGVRGFYSEYTHDGDFVLIGRQGALCGNINYAKGKFWATEHAVVAMPKQEYKLTWFGELLRIMNLNQYSMSAAQPGLSVERIENLKIPVPPLSEQKAIADFLDCKTAQIDTLIEKKQRQIALLQEQRTALINHAVIKGLNPDVPMKDSGVEWLGEVPSHWKVKKLKYVGQALIGLTYNPENVTDEENGTLVLRASNVYDGKIVFGDNVYVKMEIPKRLITKVGDILICVRSGSRDLIGKNALIDEKSAGRTFGAFMTVFRSDINNFLSYVFKSQLFKVQSGLFNTSTVNQLTQGNLYSFQIPVPPIEEQQDIIRFLNKELSQIDETINRVAKQIELLQEYRTALISEAVTGKIDVREWKKAIHE